MDRSKKFPGKSLISGCIGYDAGAPASSQKQIAPMR
jgi:hypothetical protein